MGVVDDFAPSFVKKPQLRQEDDGNRLIFECHLLSSPVPEIEWYRSEQLLTQDERTTYKIQSIGENKYSVILDLDDVTETDAGLYKVKAKNAMGEVAASINLNFSRKCTDAIHFSLPFLRPLLIEINCFASRMQLLTSPKKSKCSFWRNFSPF